MIKEELLKTILEIENAAALSDYSGHDPFDGLKSPFARLLPFNKLRLLWAYFFKWCPINLRPLFFISKGVNPEAMGLFLSSYVNLYRATGDKKWLAKAKYIRDYLLNSRSHNYEEFCWGHDFPTQNSVLFLKAGTPTVVSTSFISHALMDYHEAANDAPSLAAAVSSARFIVNSLNRFENQRHLCFSFTPLDHTRIHNANLLGASVLARVSMLTKKDEWNETIRKSAQYALDFQQEDGSWYYAETSFQKWIDSLHTGLNLSSLEIINAYLNSDSIKKSIERGTDFYAGRLFYPDGEPKYYHDNLYPIDIHSPSMGLAFLSTAKTHHNLGDQILSWTIKNMSRKKYFIYSIGRFFRNPVCYTRCGQAWVLYGLTRWYLNR